MRNKTLLIWGRRPQTPAIFRFTARMAGCTINALERRIGLSSDGTRAPTKGPEWLGAAAVAPSTQTRQSLTYCGRKTVLTTGTTFDIPRSESLLRAESFLTFRRKHIYGPVLL